MNSPSFTWDIRLSSSSSQDLYSGKREGEKGKGGNRREGEEKGGRRREGEGE